jgi:hypothetical protein
MIKTDFPKLNCSAGNLKLRDLNGSASDVVAALAAYGVGVKEIGRYLEASETTIRRDFAREIEIGRSMAKVKVHNFLFKAATGEALENPDLKATYSDCVRAAIFYAKARMGWSENIGITHSGEIKTVNALSDSELEKLIIDNGTGEIEQPKQ